MILFNSASPSAGEIFYKGGLPVKDENIEEERREARRQDVATAIIEIDCSDDDESAATVAAPIQRRIIFFTMVHQPLNSYSWSNFGDVSELSSSGVPTVSSATMRVLAPIIDALDFGHQEQRHAEPLVNSSSSTAFDVSLETTPPNQAIITPHPIKPKKREDEENVARAFGRLNLSVAPTTPPSLALVLYGRHSHSSQAMVRSGSPTAASQNQEIDDADSAASAALVNYRRTTNKASSVNQLDSNANGESNAVGRFDLSVAPSAPSYI